MPRFCRHRAFFEVPNKDFFSEDGHRFLINFPTKAHWRSKSKLEYISDGLDDFVRQIRIYRIKSVSIPPLGCGNGGLDWDEVRPLIEAKLEALDDVRIVVFPPKELAIAPEQATAPEEMTRERAILVVTLGVVEKFFGGHFTRLTIQKLTYFLQVLGVNFGLGFNKNQFGPYSETLHSALKSMEARNYIDGYTSEEREIVVTQGAFAAAQEHLGVMPDTHSEVISKLSLLVEGYESPYGMELLSSVHYLATYNGITTQPEMSEALGKWNNHKRDSFTVAAVTSALERLREDSLIG